MGTRKLPKGWEYKKLEDLIIRDNAGTWGTEGTKENGILTLRSTNFHKYRNTLNYEHEKNAYRIIPNNHIESKKLFLNDILIERSGGGPKQPVGRVAIIEEKGVGKYCGNFIQRITANEKIILPKFLLLFLSYFYLTGKTIPLQTNNIQLRNLNYKEFKKIKIYFPTSKEEQQEIVDYLDEKFKYIDEMEASRERYVEHLEKLEKAVLRDVFENIKGEYTIENLFRISSGNLVEREELSENGKYPVYGGNGIIGKTDNYNIDGEYIVIGRVGAKAGNVRLVNGKNRISDNALYIKEYLKDFNKKYLYWNLIFLDLNSKASVSNRPLISYKGIKDIKIKYPDIKTQKIIAYELDKKFELIRDSRDRLKRQEENYKNLRKAFLNDVFGGFEE